MKAYKLKILSLSGEILHEELAWGVDSYKDLADNWISPKVKELGLERGQYKLSVNEVK